jgi:hypothetical protein
MYWYSEVFCQRARNLKDTAVVVMLSDFHYSQYSLYFRHDTIFIILMHLVVFATGIT